MERTVTAKEVADAYFQDGKVTERGLILAMEAYANQKIVEFIRLNTYEPIKHKRKVRK